MLERVGAVGPAALAEAAVVRPLLHLASPSQGGSLSPQDFVSERAVVQPARERRSATGVAFEWPWDVPSRLAPHHALLAVDTRGVFAGLAYGLAVDGLEVPALGLVAALAAIPVERGTPRVRPGSKLPFSPDLSIRCDAAVVAHEIRARTPPPRGKKLVTLAIARDEQRWVTVSRR